MSDEATLSQEIIKKANQTVSITDDLGRIIVIRKPKYSHYLNLIKALGPELSKNSTYVELVGIVCAIVSINNQPMPIKAVADIEHAINVLEMSDDALGKIAAAIAENFTEFKTAEELTEAVKK